VNFLGRLFEPDEDDIKLSRPRTVAERVGAAFSRVFSVFGVVAAVAGLLFLVLVGLPSWIVVPRSAAYRAAADYALTNGDLREHIGPVLECDGIPTLYRITDGEADFVFGVKGEIGPAKLKVHLVRAAGPVEAWHVTSGRMRARLNGAPFDHDLKGR
jgi:hypothetical protein